MKYSYKWLKKLAEIDATPEELAEDLSCKSVEIENIEKFGGDFLDTVVVGEIKEIAKHPNADKLRITIIDIGSGSPTPDQVEGKFGCPSTERELEDDNSNGLLQIVCGAPNIEIGQKVPVALVGAKLPMGEIKQAKIRDIESFGMLCAEDELQLGSDHSGILILDNNLAVGTKLGDIYNDSILEGKPGANRGDLLNHVGLAREISAIYGAKLMPGVETRRGVSDYVGAIHESPVQVEIENLEACPLYTARLIKGVKIAPSPIWMQQALLACGMKPINNIVDVTNYVMLEYGNPLHAFDAKKLTNIGGSTSTREVEPPYKIVVRLSRKGEFIRTLDGKDHKLPEGLLCIANSEKPVAVAGVMGGENSEIDETTVDIILESATFSRKFIRKSQTELGITTEASSRFAKGLSRELALMGLERATQLFEEICGGKAVEVPIIAGALSGAKEPIEVDFDKINTFLSIDISKEESVKILENLGFIVEDNKILPPAWREDISIWQDIAEEIGRIYGLDKVKEEGLKLEIKPNTDKSIYLVASAKKFLVTQGLTEIFTMSILSTELIEKTKMAEHYFEIENPLNEFDKIIRSSLINGLLLYAAENAKKFDRFSLFDLSNVYLSQIEKGGSTSLVEVEPPSNEEKHLGILVYGEKSGEGLFVLKKYIEDFGEKFGISLEITCPEYSRGRNLKLEIREYMHPGRCGGIYFKDELIGQIYEIHPLVLENLDLKNRAWIAEINLEKLVGDAKNIEEKFSEVKSDVIFKEFSRFEVSKRDIAVVISAGVDASEASLLIKEADDKIISAELFDEFKSDKFGEGKKSLAFHLTFQAQYHTLNDKEVDELFYKVLDTLIKKFGAELRK